MSKLTLRSDLSKCVKDFDAKYGGMCGVKATPGDGVVYLAGTNGKVAAVVEVQGELDAPVLVPGPVCKPGVVSGGPGAWEHQKGKKVTVFREDLGGQLFPPLQEALKLRKVAATVRLDARLLDDLAKAITEGECAGHVTLLIDDADHAVGVVGNQGIGVIMPLSRGDDKASDYAATFRGVAERYAAAVKAAG